MQTNNPLVDCPKCNNDLNCDFCLGNGKVSELRWMLHKYPELVNNHELIEDEIERGKD